MLYDTFMYYYICVMLLSVNKTIKRKEMKIMLQNSWAYTQTQFMVEKYLKATRNEYQLVSQKAYQSKKNPDDKGVSLTLLITHDDMDYGVDKNGRKRDNNVLNTFDVTILNGQSEVPFKKGDKVSLVGFIPEKSYVIGFDLLLRFRDVRKAGDLNGKN